jgi:ligand-binding sensor domain-containing protein
MTPERTTDQWYEDGLAMLDSGFFDSAVECFDRVLRVEPGHAKLWVLKATAFAGMESYEKAVECFDKALEIDPRNVQAWRGKALCFASLSREEEAAQSQAEAMEVIGQVEVPLSPVKGPTLRVYGVADGLVSDSIHRLAADEDEAWFVYGEDGGASRLTLEDGRLRTYTQHNVLPSGAVRCVALGKDDVWLGTERGVSRFDRATQNWTSYSVEPGLEAGLINDLAIDGELLWLGTDSGLYVMDMATGRSVFCRGGSIPPQIDCLLAEDGRIWCGSNRQDGGVWVFDKHTEIFHRLDVGPFVRGLQLFPLNGEMRTWIAGEKGMTIVKAATYEMAEIPLPALVVTGIAVGVDSLLVGTDRGLWKVEIQKSGTERKAVVVRTDVGRGEYVTALCASSTREWIGIEGEGVLCLSYLS